MKFKEYSSKFSQVFVQMFSSLDQKLNELSHKLVTVTQEMEKMESQIEQLK